MNEAMKFYNEASETTTEINTMAYVGNYTA